MYDQLRAILDPIRAAGRDLLLEHEGYRVLALAGIDTPRHLFVARGEHPDAEAIAGLGAEELVLKVVSPQILHKSDVGGIRMVTAEASAVADALDELWSGCAQRVPEAEILGALVVEKVSLATDLPGTEFLLSARRDPAFGPYLMFGLGGLLSEWYGKLGEGRAHHLMSAEDFDAQSQLGCLNQGPLGAISLRTSRLHPEAPLDGAALTEALEGIAQLIRAEGGIGECRLEEIEVNPVVAHDGRLLALDALGRVGVRRKPSRPPRPVHKIEHLLHPRSAVVYGASTRSMNAGRIILENLKNSGGVVYGKLWAVHPKAERISGVPCVKDTASLPEVVDLAVISIPAPLAPQAIREIAETGNARSIILIPGGFAETGEGGLAEEIHEILAASREREDEGPVMVGGNCLGIVSKHEYNTFFLPTYKLPFHQAPGDTLVAVSQSGAYLVTFTSNMDGVIFPRVSVSYGNEMDLTASDILEYYLDYEGGVRVFCFYIEGFQPQEGERFLGLIRRATRMGKAVVVYKAGMTPGGAAAAQSHTASIAGDYRVAKVMLAEAGAIVCETLNQFEDYTKILTMFSERPGLGRRLGIITNAGFEAGAVADHLYRLELADFSEQTEQKLREVLPEIAHTGNPVDATPMTHTREFVRAVEIVAACDEVDSLIVSAIPATPSLDILAPDLSGRHRENIFAMHSLPSELIRVYNAIEKPMLVVIDSGRLYDESVRLLERGGVPVYRKIDRASRALSVATDYWSRKSAGS